MAKEVVVKVVLRNLHQDGTMLPLSLRKLKSLITLLVLPLRVEVNIRILLQEEEEDLLLEGEEECRVKAANEGRIKLCK